MDTKCFANPYPDYSSDNFKLVDENLDKFVVKLIHNYVKIILQNTKSEITNCNKVRGDLYVGLSGIAFMFHKLSKSSIELDLNASDLACQYSNAASKTKRSGKSISLLSGDAGIFMTSSVIKKSAQKSNKNEIHEVLKGLKSFENPEYLDDGQDEMLVGRCGYLLGILWMQREINEEIVSKSEISRLASIIIKSGRDYSNYHKKKIPLMYQYHGREYLGAAHGISAILFALLKTDLNSKDLQDVKSSIDIILSLQNDFGNFPSKFNKPEDSHLVHWCHGAPGIVYLMAKSYLKFGDAKYLDSCLNCGDLVWKFGFLHKGPGICHGIAGSGYVHLLLYRLTNDEKHLYRARKCAEFLDEEIFKTQARTPDRPYSLFEGVSGTVCFLIDLLEPMKSEFPFMNVFD